MKKKKQIQVLSLLLLSVLLLSACSMRKKAVYTTDKGDRDKSLNYVVYEGVFLDREEILSIAEDIRGSEPAYEHTVQDFHITTAYLPDTDQRDLYGTEVTVHIYGYKAGEVIMDDGTVTHNEALEADLRSDDRKLTKYLASSQEGWHITLSYEDYSYCTNQMDFSDALKTDYTVKGTFGAYLNGDFVSFDAADVDTPIADKSEEAS